MHFKLTYAALAALTLAAVYACPPDCTCDNSANLTLECNIQGAKVKIDVVNPVSMVIRCENTKDVDFSKLPRVVNSPYAFQAINISNCPLPSIPFKDVFEKLGVSQTDSLFFQNIPYLSGNFNRKLFTGLTGLSKLMLSIGGITNLPKDLFKDLKDLTWLSVRSINMDIPEDLFKPLDNLDTLEINHSMMANVSTKFLTPLISLRRFVLWQSYFNWFTNDPNYGVSGLDIVEITSCGPDELPATLFLPFKCVKILELAANEFSSFPEDLFKDSSLEVVRMINNNVKIKELPKRLFADMTSLEQVVFRKAQIEILPEDLFSHSEAIKYIDFSYNDIETLPEKIFNHQINLRGLDFSFNKLKELAPKVFLTFMKFDTGSLDSNHLRELSGNTLTPVPDGSSIKPGKIYSISIPLHFMSGYKRDITINLSYNKLDFKNTQITNNSGVVKKISPFSHINEMKMLNLSHNQIEVPFEEWWFNDYKELDISYNNIKKVWFDTKLDKKYENAIKRGTRNNVSIKGNPLDCECEQYLFLDKIKMKIVDLQDLNCPAWLNQGCNMRYTVFVPIITLVILLYIAIVIVFIIYRKNISNMLKTRFQKYTKTPQLDKMKKCNVIIKYCDMDEEFVMKDILPVMKCNKNIKVYTNVIKKSNTKTNFGGNFANCFNDANKCTEMVIFSANYLTTTYSQVDIKKIHTEMLKAENTIYVFIDNGPENSVYAFLEEQRDVTKTMVWNELNFWEKIFSMMSYDQINGKYTECYDLLKPNNSNISFSKMPDCLNMTDTDTLKHSQV